MNVWLALTTVMTMLHVPTTMVPSAVHAILVTRVMASLVPTSTNVSPATTTATSTPRAPTMPALFHALAKTGTAATA